MDADVIRAAMRGERQRCIDVLKRMAAYAEKHPPGITFEGGIRADDVATILRAAARELELPPEPLATRELAFPAPDA